MRSLLYVVLAIFGVTGAVVLLSRRGGAERRDGNPTQEAERLLDRCRDMLSGIDSAVRQFQGPGEAASS